jgi:hypothetical protein
MTGFRHPVFASLVAMVVGATSTAAADGIVVSRGDDATSFGVCVPSMTVENKSRETIDFLQVDLMVGLADGRQSTVELQSAYRTGIVLPIAPGAKATLKQHLDLTPSLGVPCSEVKTRKVARVVCEAAGGKACSSAVDAKP